MKSLRLLLPLLALCPAAFSRAEVTLPHLLSSHMVLQRNRPIHLWGWADPGEQVTATLHGSSAAAKADDLGHWSLYLPAEKAGGPYQVTIAGTNRIVLDDVLVGDVWVASGQSNMEFPLLGFGPTTPMQNGAEEIRNANQPQLRLMLVQKATSPYPLQDVNTDPQAGSPEGWTLCTPDTAAHFSAAAYFFAREIAAKEHVPVGVIDSTWGGTPGESWVSMDGLAADPGLMPVFAFWADKSRDAGDVPRLQAAEKRADEAATAAGKPKPQHPWHPDLRSWNPSWLFNGMIAPLTPLPIQGVIWYQGETNSDVRRALSYERIFPALIEDWRKQWGQGDFPFLYVQISSFRSNAGEDWPVIREAQRRTLKLVNTAMAVTIDIGNPENVHPADKQDVGHRLALAARAVAYGEQVEDSGPLFRQATPAGDAIQVWFDHGDGLTAKHGELTGFEVAGADRNFTRAEAKIEHHEAGEYISVSSPSVSQPLYVRYGWQNAPAPTLNLYNAAGLPASPFTSEKDIPAPDPAHPTN
ncbi:sialate O-acetylesterase [Silvibacterium dinghuense]|uniref:Sialate O-acetylesterase n=1 Tax=Silvibacterium dinghuense TaxID=1560006 RepID=A0A4Q1SK05_9BACT|nr:sialate O-acetylesterase [Silvibacterium dinghuense]RXS98008.1 sialate O-acetylesterase [Silvibacterium dinghuense]